MEHLATQLLSTSKKLKRFASCPSISTFLKQKGYSSIVAEKLQTLVDDWSGNADSVREQFLNLQKDSSLLGKAFRQIVEHSQNFHQSSIKVFRYTSSGRFRPDSAQSWTLKYESAVNFGLEALSISGTEGSPIILIATAPPKSILISSKAFQIGFEGEDEILINSQLLTEIKSIAKYSEELDEFIPI